MSVLPYFSLGPFDTQHFIDFAGSYKISHWVGKEWWKSAVEVEVAEAGFAVVAVAVSVVGVGGLEAEAVEVDEERVGADLVEEVEAEVRPILMLVQSMGVLPFLTLPLSLQGINELSTSKSGRFDVYDYL